MKLWIVNHPHELRRWLKVRARLKDAEGWREAFVWSEWFGPTAGGSFDVPRLPSQELTEANVDPLVIGPRMYFDYCRKGGKGANALAPNSFSCGDLVLFGCRHKGNIIIDTVFVVGASKQWPAYGAPAWEDVDALAARVHFHAAAHEHQHPEVHGTRHVPAQSYQGKSYSRTDHGLFCWIPCLTDLSTSEPLVLRADAYDTLTNAFRNRTTLENGMIGSFSVVEIEEAVAHVIFTALEGEAFAQGFQCAVELRLFDDHVTGHGHAAMGPCCAVEHPSERDDIEHVSPVTRSSTPCSTK